jgi:hypothetical protein
MGQSKVSQQIQGSDPEDEGGDGVPCQGHPNEGLHKLQVHLKERRKNYGFIAATVYLKTTPRINDTGRRRLRISVIRGVSDSPYR